MSNGEQDLHSAARSGDLNKVRSILSSNPLSVNSRDKHSRTPWTSLTKATLLHRLHLASWSGQTEVVRYLCQQKADVGASAMDDMAAIHFAAQKGHLEVVRILLSSGASVKACTRKGLTPLHYAVQGSHLELVKFLVKKGASLSVKTKSGKTPADLACNEEISSFLEESEQSTKKGNLNGKEKADENDSKHSLPEKSETSANTNEESENERVKRKEHEDNVEEATAGPKKAKVALKHLLTEDDTQEDDEAF